MSETKSKISCSVCGRSDRLKADYDRDTGRLRGTLCGRCRDFFEAMNYDPQRIRSLISYVEKHAAPS